MAVEKGSSGGERLLRFTVAVIRAVVIIKVGAYGNTPLRMMDGNTPLRMMVRAKMGIRNIMRLSCDPVGEKV